MILAFTLMPDAALRSRGLSYGRVLYMIQCTKLPLQKTKMERNKCGTIYSMWLGSRKILNYESYLYLVMIPAFIYAFK